MTDTKQAMTLKEIERTERTEIHVCTEYQLGDHYKVKHYQVVDEYGSKTKRVSVRPTEEYYPNIYYRETLFKPGTLERQGFFVIDEAMSYRPKDAQKVSKGYEEAKKAVKVLNEALCK